MSTNNETINKLLAFDKELFKPVPPENPELVKSLFCGRAEELRTALACLQADLDVDGKRAALCLKRPWIIHGESRSGKSHLARRIAVEFEDDGKRRRVIIQSRQRVSAVRVMADIFDAVMEVFLSLERTADFEPTTPKGILLRLTKELAVQVHNLIGMADSVIIGITKEDRKKLNAAFTVVPIPKLLEFCLGFGSETGEGKRTEVKLAPPTAKELAEKCGLILDTLKRLGLLDHILILVDDVDLLDRAPQRELPRRDQCSELTDALGILHRTAGVDVLITARSWYVQLFREFNDLINLSSFPQPTEDVLIEIHDKRVHCFRKELKAPKRFLNEEVMRRAAKLAGGKPGVWLKHLETAFEKYVRDPNWDERDWEWYMQVFEEIIVQHQALDPEATKVLTDAVVEKRVIIDADKANLYSGTPFDEVFWIDCYVKQNSVSLVQLAFQVVERLKNRRKQT